MKDHRGTPAGRSGSAPDLTGRIRWWKVLRLTVATVILIVSILLQVREGEGFFSTPMRGLYLFAGLAYLLAIVYAVFERRVRDRVRFAIVQIAGDLVLLSGIVLITGGAASPFIILYFLIIIGAGILFYRAGSMIAAAASAVLFGIAVAAPLVPRVAAIIDPGGTTLAMGRAAVGYRHLLAVFSFFLVAFLASYLAESLRRVGEELSQASASLADLERRSEHISVSAHVRNEHRSPLAIQTDGHKTPPFRKGSAKDVLDAVQKRLAARDHSGVGAVLVNLDHQARLAAQPLSEEFVHERIRPAAEVGDVNGI